MISTVLNSGSSTLLKTTPLFSFDWNGTVTICRLSYLEEEEKVKGSKGEPRSEIV
jgi:hypothetical protein